MTDDETRARAMTALFAAVGSVALVIVVALVWWLL